MAAIAARYARALADVASDPATGLTGNALREQLSSFLAAYESSGELRNVLANPAVPAPKKRAIVERLAQPLQLSRIAQNFLFVVIDHRRTRWLKEILDTFEAILDEKLGIARADVTTAAQLAPAERALIESSLRKLTGKAVRAQFEVDPALIGGARARIGSTIYDGSVAEQLRQIRERLTH